MAFSIAVKRGVGLHQGPDIVDPLIRVLPVALERGRNELDEQSSGLQYVDLSFAFRPGYRNGQVIEVTETLFGTVWYGKIAGISHSYNGVEAITELRVARPTDFSTVSTVPIWNVSPTLPPSSPV